jgi:hypothetical protein
MREKLTTGEAPFRKAYLGSIVDRIEVDDREIRIIGRKDVLEQEGLVKGGPVPGVRSFVRKWRPVGEFAFSVLSTTYKKVSQKSIPYDLKGLCRQWLTSCACADSEWEGGPLSRQGGLVRTDLRRDVPEPD